MGDLHAALKTIGKGSFAPSPCVDLRFDDDLATPKFPGHGPRFLRAGRRATGSRDDAELLEKFAALVFVNVQKESGS